jgi:hypothetical protein
MQSMMQSLDMLQAISKGYDMKIRGTSLILMDYVNTMLYDLLKVDLDNMESLWKNVLDGIIPEATIKDMHNLIQFTRRCGGDKYDNIWQKYIRREIKRVERGGELYTLRLFVRLGYSNMIRNVMDEYYEEVKSEEGRDKIHQMLMYMARRGY